jgi:hypothetical protein
MRNEMVSSQMPVMTYFTRLWPYHGMVEIVSFKKIAVPTAQVTHASDPSFAKTATNSFKKF